MVHNLVNNGPIFTKDTRKCSELTASCDRMKINQEFVKIKKNNIQSTVQFKLV